MRDVLRLALGASILLATSPAAADADPRGEPVSPFDRDFAVGGYVTGHAGSYFAGGIGGRLRWEPFDWLGVETYLEATLVDWAGDGFRHDYPNGFNLYVPVRFGAFRIRPFFGFCDVISLVEPAQPHAPRADDVLLGAHAGLGGEWALHSMWSLFADLQVNVYAGHDRTVAGWTGGLDSQLVPFWNIQLNLGVQLHVGNP